MKVMLQLVRPERPLNFLPRWTRKRKWQLRVRQRRQDDVPTHCIRTACVNIVSANISTVTLGCGPLCGASLPILNSGCSRLRHKHSCWRPTVCFPHLTIWKTESHKVVYIRRKCTAKRGKASKNKKVLHKKFLTFIFRTLNSSVAADGRLYSHFKSPTLEQNGKSFLFRP